MISWIKHCVSFPDRRSTCQNALACDVCAYLNLIWTFSDSRDMCTSFHPCDTQCAPERKGKRPIKMDVSFRKAEWTWFDKMQRTVNESCRLKTLSQIVHGNDASACTNRLWWFKAVRVGLVLWQMSHFCGLSVCILKCLFNVPRFLSQAPHILHWTRGSSTPKCCVFMWSWKPSLVLKTFAQTSQIRWSTRSCTFKMCILSMWSDLKLWTEIQKENIEIKQKIHSICWRPNDVENFNQIIYVFWQMWQMNFWSPIGWTSLKWRFRICCLENRLWHWWHSKLRFSSSSWRSVCAASVRFSKNFFGHFLQLRMKWHTNNI